MRFLKLLDPYGKSDVGGQQRRAGELFPQLVATSRFNYWRPGDAIYADGDRLLVGLYASFNLVDLRLADIMNAERSHNPTVRVDVFNLDDCRDDAALGRYFPIPPRFPAPSPYVGFWRDGVHRKTLSGYDARAFILLALDAPVTADEATDNLRPPAAHRMNDHE